MSAQERITQRTLTQREHVTVELDALIEERDEALRQLDNANRINQDQASAMTKLERENAELKRNTPAELTGQAAELATAIASIKSVVALQLDLLSGTGSLARMADIRRRQVAKGYTLEHDREHEPSGSSFGPPKLVTAALALIRGNVGYWPHPWPREMFDKLVQDPDRLLHAAALLCAQQDVDDYMRNTEVPF